MSNPDPTEVAQRHDETQLHALFECMPQLGWAARPDGWIYYYNRQWFEFTGTTTQQMEGWGWQTVHHPELLPLVMKRWTHSIATGEPFEMAFQLRRHDGEFRWFLTRVNPMRDAQGTLIRWVGINTDIHEQKQAEEAAATASRAKDEFLAMLGHELRNPLAPIVTALKLMELRGSDVHRRERTIIERQTVHLSRLVDDNADAAESLAETLQRHGHVVHVAYDAASALSAAEVFGPEVALLDLGLPDMDGYELAQRFRGHPRLRHVRIVAVTGYGQSSDRERTREAGFHRHFVKPVDLEELLQAVEQPMDADTA